MQTIATIKSFTEATSQCIQSPNISEQDKTILRETQNFLQISYIATKVAIAAGFVGLVDWKTPKPIMRRQVPYAFLAFGMCALADYLSFRYAFGRSEAVLVKHTGFRDGVFVHPDKFITMKNSFRSAGGRPYQENKNDDLID